MNNDLQFLLDWDKNPQQIFMPLKRCNPETKRPQFACLVLDHGPVLFHTNMFSFDRDCRKERFETYAEIINAGWVVD